MISYKKFADGETLDSNSLEGRIKELSPQWIAKAKKRTQKYKTAGKVTDSKHIWSEIKEVFMDLQGNKCAFCETELEGKAVGKGDHDIEHFRPKNRITKWTSWTPEFEDLNIGITIPNKSSSGYHLLTYNLDNYSIACGPCNQNIKRDRFPVKGDYNLSMENPLTESEEEIPLLLFPIGDNAQNCEDLIHFEGPVPVSSKASGLDYEKAITTIEFFKLNRPDERGKLFKERCDQILLLDILLRNENNSSVNENIISNMLSDQYKHANCCRSYYKLYNEEPEKSKLILEEAMLFMSTYIPS